MNILTAILQALQSPLGLLLLGFCLTTVLGGLLTTRLQRALWERQTRLEVFRRRYEEGTVFLDQLSSLIDRRLFGLQRLLWVIEEGVEADQLETKEREYFQTVIEWNGTLRSNRNKIRLLIGESQASDFLDYRDDGRQEHPRSLHYQFVKAHNAVISANSGGMSTEQAQREVNSLNWTCSSFLEDLTTVFAQRATSLTLLDIPDKVQSNETENNST